LEQNSAAPLNKNLQKDGRFSPQYQKVLDALPDAKSYLVQLVIDRVRKSN
jgi:hypothetical protein